MPNCKACAKAWKHVCCDEYVPYIYTPAMTQECCECHDGKVNHFEPKEEIEIKSDDDAVNTLEELISLIARGGFTEGLPGSRRAKYVRAIRYAIAKIQGG